MLDHIIIILVVFMRLLVFVFFNVITLIQVPREQKKEIYEPVDYMKQFQEEEEKIKEDERRAKEDLERKLREEEVSEDMFKFLF